METQPSLSFKPLEYWKPPKAVSHLRRKSSTDLQPRATASGGETQENIKDLGNEDMAFGRKNNFTQSVQMADDYNRPLSQPPPYQLDRPDTLNRPWYKRTGKKFYAIVAAVVVLVIVIVIIIAVEVTKSSPYPDYSKLTYSLTDSYSGTSFFDDWDYYTGYDPTDGFVHYVASEEASSLNLTYASSSSAVVRVDTSVTADSNPNASTGRFSVRMTSPRQYGVNNLVLFDVIHTPIGCATWPALWLSDESNWPYNGEIDVMEAVNVAGSGNNQMTLHTSAGCTMGVKRKETGHALQTSCVNTTNENAGCGVEASTKDTTFGDYFNTAGGGLLALEIQTAGIRVWQFPRARIPSDVSAGSPEPSTWGEATADYPNTDCDIATHFKNQSIIINIDLCGSWAGAESIYAETCSAYGTANSLFSGSTACEDHVANNATAFTDAYWEFGAFQIYTAA